MMIQRLFSAIIIGMLSIITFNAYAYTPKAEKVIDNVYAIIGPLDQRSKDNDGLNNNLGFIVGNESVILIDSGASKIGAQRIEAAIREITDKPVKWVVNTGSQDHRWLGNDYFASKGAEVIALQRMAETQSQYAEQQLTLLKRFLGERLTGTKALPATKKISGNDVTLKLGGETLVLRYTDTHYTGDAWVWLPKHKVMFTGDLVYVDRVFAVLPWSSVVNGQKAFMAMEKIKPVYIVPGHGRVCDLQTARKDSGDYYDFLVNSIGKAAQEMESMDDVMNRYSTLPQFQHLKHFNSLHRTNMNRTFLEFERM
jgi:glyoxylase-like metal-dependent hydrolase (beta-lactamase superfamily II)